MAAAHAELDHVRVVEQQQRASDPAGAAIVNERALQRQRVLVGNESQFPDVEYTRASQCVSHPTCLTRPAYTAFGSQFSSCFFTCDMKWSATAPSITR